MAKKTKKNPQDLTLRNHRAHARRIAELERVVKALRADVDRLLACVPSAGQSR